MGRLTTHVLDTANGCPAAGVRLVLRALGVVDEGRLITEVITNADGRTDAPLLTGEELKPGRYELVFHVGAYFAAAGAAQADPPFLDQVPIRFGHRQTKIVATLGPASSDPATTRAALVTR